VVGVKASVGTAGTRLRCEYGENRTKGVTFVSTLNGICPPTVSPGHAIREDYDGPMLASTCNSNIVADSTSLLCHLVQQLLRAKR